MKTIVMTCAGLLLFAAPMPAAEVTVSDASLGDMGLSGMERISDEQGLAIRGKGTYSNVWGGSTATYNQTSGSPWGSFAAGPATTASNNYEAGAQWHGKNSAANGQSLSFAGHVAVQFAGTDLTSLTAKAGLSAGLTSSLAN